MAPIACLMDYPMVAAEASSNTRSRHRPNRDGIISKRQRLTLKQCPKIAGGIRTSVANLPVGKICVADTPSHLMLPEANLPDDPVIKSTLVTNRRKELMDIVMRTLALVRRNYVLQVRLDSLRLESKNFFQSVLNNTENNNCQKNHDSTTFDDSHLVSSSTDCKINEKQIISLPFYNETSRLTLSPRNQSISTCISSSNEKNIISRNY